jgi:hypothetical protein
MLNRVGILNDDAIRHVLEGAGAGQAPLRHGCDPARCAGAVPPPGWSAQGGGGVQVGVGLHRWGHAVVRHALGVLFVKAEATFFLTTRLL